MATTLTQSESAQLAQTVEMFEVIVQSQPHDYQSLEILKEAYSKLNREQDVLKTAKRIADAYVQMGQYSSAILEFETILQRYPDDAEAQKALKEIESKSTNIAVEPSIAEPAALAPKPAAPAPAEAPAKPGAKSPAAPVAAQKPSASQVEDGRKQMHKIFVESKLIAASDFDMYWHTPDPVAPPTAVVDPFIQVLHDKGTLPAEKAIKLLTDKTRIAFLPLEKYDIDMELARSFPPDVCRRWCVLPFDRMSKSVMVATCNPFNQQAARELADATPNRLLWFLVQPAELVKTIRKVFR